MLDGLLGLLGGETTALLVWAAAGATLAAVLWLVMIVWGKGDLPWKTEKDMHGKTRTGARRWLLIFILVLTWLPLAMFVYRMLAGIVGLFLELLATITAAGEWTLRHWWLFALLGVVYAVWRLSRSPRIMAHVRAWLEERRQPPEPVQAPPTPHDPIPHGAPREGLPVGVAQDGSLLYVQPEAQQTPQPVPDDYWARPSASQ